MSLPVQTFALEHVETPTGQLLVPTDDQHRLRAVDWQDHEPRMHRLLRQQYGAIVVRRALAGQVGQESGGVVAAAASQYWPAGHAPIVGEIAMQHFRRRVVLGQRGVGPVALATWRCFSSTSSALMAEVPRSTLGNTKLCP